MLRRRKMKKDEKQVVNCIQRRLIDKKNLPYRFMETIFRCFFEKDAKRFESGDLES
jgi:ribosome maturation protein Sdo1